MAGTKTERKCFTFLWKLENISYSLQKKGEKLVSPAFLVDALEGSKWKLWLYPRGDTNRNYMSCFLHREADSKGAVKIEIRYELAVIGKDGSVLNQNGTLKNDFIKGIGFGYRAFAKRECLFILRKSEFHPQNTLSVRCKMWKSVEEISKDVQFVAYTRIGVQKQSFLWNVKEFSKLGFEGKHTYQIKSTENDSDLLSIDLSLYGGLSSDEIINIELSLQDETIKFCTLRLFLIDVSGNKIECNHDEFWFDDDEVINSFAFSFTKTKLLSKKSVYLPEDILSLHFDWAFSKGVVFEEIQSAQHGCISSGIEISHPQNVDVDRIVPSQILNENLKRLYDEKFLCDVKLQTSTSTFPAHKIILSASSSVFKAMFSNDMREKGNNCVNIEDLSDDTVQRLLLYTYTAKTENLTWESATQLYVAADKYAIITLKNICSSYLKENISPKSASDFLLLSDSHSDNELKAAIQDYILNHDKEVINSDGWKLLMETNPKLAAETLCLRYK